MPPGSPELILVGHPNVGKSRLFNLLTRKQVAVSNYPGTTVELTHGKADINGKTIMVVDTPGLYSLEAVSPEEQVTRLILVEKRPSLVIQVADARNLPRMLGLTLELLEAGVPLILVLNMMDEAKASGLTINSTLLSRRLGVPVIPAALISGSGLKQIRRTASELLQMDGSGSDGIIKYRLDSLPLARALERLANALHGNYGISRRALATALLNPDPSLKALVAKREGMRPELKLYLQELKQYDHALLTVATARRRAATELLKGVISYPDREPFSFAEKISTILVNPLSGWPVLLLVLFFGFYQFVGRFGAGTLVELLEKRLFLERLAPVLNYWGELYLPWDWLRELLVMDYGIFTLGLRYTFAIILPIMACFFLFFSIVEDSGYLPRAAYLVNRAMEAVGLSGKAVIPLTLGFGCGTLAVLTTRTLDSRRERLQASLLLSLSIPCSAQLGLILALLPAGSPIYLWLGALLCAFIAAARIGRTLFGAAEQTFCLEIPPLRPPQWGAILRKTAARLRWYLKEVMPLFAGISVLMWFLRQTGLIDLIIRGFQPVASSLGLPSEAALIFVYGFLRRDYGAAGLFDLARSSALSPGQLVVAAVALTLFLPCAAQCTVLLREHGLGFTALVIATTALVAWLGGMAIHLIISIPAIANFL
jgi:ferrous iron transport protein B